MHRTALLALALLLPVAAMGQEDPAAAIEKAVGAAKAEAARLRGLSFSRDVPVARITSDDFRAQMLRDIRRVFGEGEALAHMETLLRLLRILPADAGLVDVADRFFPETVAANYDTVEKRISILRDYRRPEALHSLLVHEMVHALQDQHFGLEAILSRLEPTFDRLLAFGGLVEGDAESVQRTLDTGGLLAMTPLETIRAFGEKQVEQYLARMKGFPRGVARPFIFQYFDGLLFVETVKRARGGQAAVDRAYADPPQSTEQVLHPGRYLVRDHPTAIIPPAPPPGWRILLSNTLGELGISIVVEEHLGAGYGFVAEGWDGDRILLLGRGDGAPVLAWYATFDTVRDAGEFAAAAEEMFRVRRPGQPVNKGATEPLWLQTDGALSHLIRSEGRDVLVVEGVPAGQEATVLGTLLSAEKEQVVIERGRFGTGR